MIKSHPMHLILDAITGATTVRPNASRERFPDLEFAALQAKSRPNALVRWWRARQDEKKRVDLLIFLSELSPHMLDDIGVRWTAAGEFEKITEASLTVSADQSIATPDDQHAPQPQLQPIEAMVRAA